MSYRLFAALPIPEPICDMLKGMQKGLDGANWRHKENLHLTLRFYGNVSENTAHDLDAALAEIDLPPITLRLSGVDQFGGFEPHTLWAGIKPNETLLRLAEKCARPMRELGIKKDKHTYIPHVTLAYLNHMPPQSAPELVAGYLQRHAMFETPEFTVNRFALYSSTPGKHQSHYHEEASYPLLKCN